MATITDSGTWTTLNFPTTDIGPTDPNVPTLPELNVAGDLRDVDLSELTQFIQLAATAYSISFWSAATLIETALKILKHRDVPAEQSRSFTP